MKERGTSGAGEPRVPRVLGVPPQAYSWTWHDWERRSPWSNPWNSPGDTMSNDPRQYGDGRGEVIPSFDGTDFQTVREAGSSCCVQYTSGPSEEVWETSGATGRTWIRSV